MGIAPESDEARLDEIVQILEKAFSGKPFSFSGKYYEIPTVTVTPGPLTPGGPPMLLAGDGVVDRDAVRAAQRGKPYLIDPSLPLEEISRLVALYDAAYQGERALDLPFFNYGFVSDDSDPWEEMRAGFTYLRQTYDRWAGRPVRDVQRGNHRLLLGSVRQVTDQVLEYHRMFGDRLHFIMRLDYPGSDPVRSDRAVQAWGEVADSVRRELASRK